MTKVEIKQLAREIADESIQSLRQETSMAITKITEEASAMIVKARMDAAETTALLRKEGAEFIARLELESTAVIHNTQSAFMIKLEEQSVDWQNQVHIVTEKMRDDFRVYGDAFNTISADIKEMKTTISSVENRLGSVEDRLVNIEGDVGQIKTYIFKNVEPRMIVLEKGTPVSYVTI